MNMKKPSIKFEIDTSITNALSSSTAIFQKDCMRRLCLYEFSLAFSEPLRAELEVTSTTGSLGFNDIVSTTLRTFDGDNIDKANITLGGVEPESEHTEAIDYFYRQIDKLHESGWRRYIFPDEARIPGSQAQKFDSVRSIFGAPVETGPWNDPSLKLTKEKWLAMPMFSSWYFYKNGTYLSLQVQRQSSEIAPLTRGSYLFTLTFESETEFYKSFVEGEKNRANWKALVPAELNRMAQERAQTEARLKKMGIAIDENYQDPPIKALE
ncbi:MULTISPECIES: hypothetical protein [unclassified Pseudomonas]|uniref:hypothetical protein n=1 Tax=unclassified Pseudomonas TaxID=196821 RepID=UPI003808EFDF